MNKQFYILSEKQYQQLKDKNMFPNNSIQSEKIPDNESNQVDCQVIRQLVWEARSKYIQENYKEPKYLILSGARYEALRKECYKMIGNYAKDLEVMNRYMGLIVTVIPQTYEVDIVEVAV